MWVNTVSNERFLVLLCMYVVGVCNVYCAYDDLLWIPRGHAKYIMTKLKIFRYEYPTTLSVNMYTAKVWHGCMAMFGYCNYFAANWAEIRNAL